MANGTRRALEQQRAHTSIKAAGNSVDAETINPITPIINSVPATIPIATYVPRF